MRTELIFFDNFNNGIKGTKRGIIAFISLIIIHFLWYLVMKNKYYISKKPINIYSMIFVWLLICSALAVQIPKNYKESFFYSFLIGLVIFGVFNFTNYSILSEWNLNISIIDTIFGIISCIIAGSLIYLIYWKNYIQKFYN